MKIVSPSFISEEAKQIQNPVVKAVIRPNPDVLRWQKTFENTGLSGKWQGANYTRHTACVTTAGTLIRVYAYTLGNDTGQWGIYINRVPTGTGDPTQSQVSTWTLLTTQAVNFTNETIVSYGGVTRIFFVRAGNPASIAFYTSTDDGQTWTGPTTVDAGTEVWGLTGLASPDPNVVFASTRRFSPAGPQGQVEWVQLTAFQYLDGSWVKTRHPKTSTRVPLASNSFWVSSLQFDAAVIDRVKGRYVTVSLDDIAGRPASSVYQNRHWSDFHPIENIDFAEPERDEVIGFRMRNVGDKILLSAYQTQADSDFSSVQSGVLYYTADGMNWSDAYHLLDPYEMNYGTPILWRNKLWLVGSDSLWSADPTSFFGNLTPNDSDVTISARSIRIDEPEDPQAPSTLDMDLDNAHRQWTSHSTLREGAEIEVLGGYAGSELVSMYQGRISQALPRASFDDSMITVSAVDMLDNFSRGVVDRSIVFSDVFRDDIRFDTDADIQRFAVPKGSWGYVSFGGRQYMRASEVGDNVAAIGTGLSDNYRVSANFRIVDTYNTAPPSGYEATSGMGLIWAANEELDTYYIVRSVPGDPHFQLWKTISGVGTMISQAPIVGPASATINKWFRISVIYSSGVITVSYQQDGDNEIYNLFEYADPQPLKGKVIAFRGTLLYESPDEYNQYQTVDVDNIRIISEDVQTSIEDVVTTLAVQRGFSGVEAEQHIRDTFTSGLSGWTQLGVSGGWSTSSGGLTYNSSGKTNAQYRILRSNLQVRDTLVDMDIKLGNTTSDDSVFGIVCRATADAVSRVEFVVLAHLADMSDGTTRPGATALVRVIAPNGAVHSVSEWCRVPIYLNRRTTLRFIVDGPWYTLYINGLHAASLYDDTLIREGYIGISDGLEVVSGNVQLYEIRVPWLGLGNVPVIEVGSTLDTALNEILDAEDAWMQADGRILRIGKTEPTSLPIPAQGIWLNGGFEVSGDPAFTHCRVISESDGYEMTGTAVATNLWKQSGIRIWNIVTVDGLKSENECREKAKSIILEAERNRRKRSYEVHPRLIWEKYDRLSSVNQFDDTDRILVVSGIERQWSKTEDSGQWVVSMTTRLEEQNSDAVTFATTFQP